VRALRKGSPKTIKYNSGLRVTYFAMADDAFPTGTCCGLGTQQHCFQDYRRAGKKRRRYPGPFDSRSVICARRAIPRQRDRKRSDETRAENAPGHSDFMSAYFSKRITGVSARSKSSSPMAT